MAALLCSHCGRLAVGGRCRTSPFIVRCHVSPISYMKKGEGEGGDLLLTSTVSVDHRSPFVVVTVHPLLVAMSPTATWRLLLV